SDAAHAPVWAFEVPDDVISAGEPGGRMSVRKITDDAASWPPQRSCYRGAHAAARLTPASRARNLAARAIAAVAVHARRRLSYSARNAGRLKPGDRRSPSQTVAA